nr:eukaryotic translation initiation factor 3 subunit J-like [Drosophila suzukii]
MLSPKGFNAVTPSAQRWDRPARPYWYLRRCGRCSSEFLNIMGLGSLKDEEKPTKTEAPDKTKPSKALKAKMEQQARLEEEAEAERLANLSPEDKLAEKLRLQKIQEASDLKHVQDAFGVTSTSGGFDAFNPESKEEFKEFGTTNSWKVAQFRESEHFPQFVEDLVRSLCVNLSAADIKKVKMNVEILHSEKLKQGPEHSSSIACGPAPYYSSNLCRDAIVLCSLVSTPYRLWSGTVLPIVTRVATRSDCNKQRPRARDERPYPSSSRGVTRILSS